MKEIDSLHMLIHPAFTASVEGSNRWLNLSDTLLPKYLILASSLKETGLLVIFLHRFAENWQRDVDAQVPYTSVVNELRTFLPDRTIVIPQLNSHCPSVDHLESNVYPDRFITELQVKEIDVPKNVLTYAYGETARACVPRLAQTMNTALRWTKKTRIVLEATDRHDDEERERKLTESKLRTSYNRVMLGQSTFL